MSDDSTPSGWSAEQPPPSDEGFAGSSRPALPGWGPAPPPAPPAGWGSVPPADQPGVIPLQPLGLGQIYEGAFATVRRSWRAIGVVAGLTAVVVFGVSMVAWLSLTTASQQLVDVVDAIQRLPRGTVPTSAQDDLLVHAGLRIGIVVLAMVALLLVANVLVSGAMTVVVGRVVIGRPISAALLWRELRPVMLRLIAVTLLVTLGVTGGALLCVVPGVILLVFWVVAAPAVVLERCGPVTAMRRSWRLVRGSWWRVFGIFLLSYLIVYLISGIVSAPLQVLTSLGSLDQFTSASSAPNGLQVLPTTGVAAFGLALSQAVTTLIAVPLLACIISLLYVDLRIRKENLAPTLSAAARAPQQ